MDRAKLITAIRPLALAFAGELADVLHKHYSARVEAARKGAIDRLREDLENGDAHVRADRKSTRPKLSAKSGRKRAAVLGRRAVSRRGHRDGAPAATPRAKEAAPIAAKVTGVKTCSACGEAGHNKRGCEKRAKDATARASAWPAIAQRDVKPAKPSAPSSPPQRLAPSKLDRFSRIEAAARAREASQ